MNNSPNQSTRVLKNALNIPTSVTPQEPRQKSMETQTEPYLESELEQHNTIETPLHIDVMFPGSLTAIFYMNTNNGYTYFEDGTKVESVENRLVVFPSYFSHAGATCTDEQRRVVININYITDAENSIWKKIKTKHDIEYENEWARLCGDY